MQIGFRSPIYRRKRKQKQKQKQSPSDFVRDCAALRQATTTAANRLGLAFDGETILNPTRLLRKSTGTRVSGSKGPGWLKVTGHSDKSKLPVSEGQTHLLTGIAKPEILETLDWFDGATHWQALYMTLSPGSTVFDTPWLSGSRAAPDDAWLEALKANLTRLAQIPSPRTSSIAAHIFGCLADVEGNVPAITELVTSHGDLHWANLCSPFFMLDWDCYGSAPRGFDPAYLISFSFADPALCARIRSLFKDDLESSSGIASQIYCCHRQFQLIEYGICPAPYKTHVDAELKKLKR